MKITRMISVDLEMYQHIRAKGVNFSGLCNTLLAEWLKKQVPKTKEERDKEIKAMEIELEALDKLEALKNE